MANDEDMSNSDDEYHFSEIGSSASAGNVYGGGAAKRHTDSNSTLRRNLLIGLGVLLLLFLAYKLVGVFFNKMPAQEEASTSAVQVTQVKQQSQEQQRAESLAKEKQLAAQQVMDQRLREQHIEQVSGNVERVQGQLLDVGNRISDMNMFMQRVAQQMQQQQQVLQQLQTQLQAQAGKKTPKSLSARQAKSQPRDPYFIKAIIPGRAWLLSEAGNFLTVTHGTQIPRYGRVEYIDAAKGLVSTSSGDLISYSSSDI